MTHERLPINQEAHSAIAKRVEKNRQILSSVVKTIIFLGKQNILLRGHRDDSTALEVPDVNPGKFQCFLRFRIESGDDLIEKHFQSCPRNAKYCSKPSKMN